MELRWRELHGHAAPEVCAGAGARECRSQARRGRQLAGSTLEQRPAVSACMEVAKSNPPRTERGRELRSKGNSSPGVLPTAGVPIPVTP